MMLKGQLQGPRRALDAQRTRHVITPRVRRAFVENFSDAPRAQDNLSNFVSTSFLCDNFFLTAAFAALLTRGEHCGVTLQLSF